MDKKKSFNSYFYWLLISAFLLITLNACEGTSGRRGAVANQNMEPAQTGKWTMISGDTKPDQPGVYGTRGTAAGTNKPGARYGSVSWKDDMGNLWLFGGGTGSGYTKFLNDLWEFDGTNWTWISGDKERNERGVYGTKGVPGNANKPGARYGSTSWYDKKGNLWLFGGYGYAAGKYQGALNDLWKFDGTNWTWVSGGEKIERRGIYGTKGIASATNTPGARYDSMSWTDKKGNLWLFGGRGYSAGMFGNLNDLWKFDGDNWTWISGVNRMDEPGIYGTKGIADSANVPGPRYGGVSWIDSKGNLWLFGGIGSTEIRTSGDLNDLWKFDGTNWTWISGDKSDNRMGVYGFMGVAASNNKPGSRYGSIGWIDREDNLWLFGGKGYNKTRSSLLNDLWKFDGTNWTWVSGKKSSSSPDKENEPNPRYYSISWTDREGNLWLFGGKKHYSDNFNDLWKYEP